MSKLPFGQPHAVYHGPTSFIPLTYDPYLDSKKLGIYREIGKHDFQDVNAETIVERILKSRKLYEARQAAKGEKGLLETRLLNSTGTQMQGSRGSCDG